MSEALTDGYLKYGTKETQRSERGKVIGSGFKQLGHLAYREVSCRDSDYEMAKAMTAVLDLKLKTLCPPQLRNYDKSKLIIIVEGIEYDVIKADTDREKRFLYLYLQKVN